MRTLLTALMLTVLPALSAGQDAAPAPEAPKPAAAPFAPELARAEKDLAILKERWPEAQPKDLDALKPELEKLSAAVEKALGPEILADAARREEAARAAGAKKALAAIRTALQAGYAEKGEYPAGLPAPTTGYLAVMPELELPGHAATSAVRIADAGKYTSSDIEKAVEDTGGWLYFSGKGSANDGLLVIDCRHKDPAGQEFFRY